MAPRNVFTVQERGETDVAELANALRSRAYSQIPAQEASPKPGEFFIAKRRGVRVLVCCERKESPSCL